MQEKEHTFKQFESKIYKNSKLRFNTTKVIRGTPECLYNDEFTSIAQTGCCSV